MSEAPRPTATGRSLPDPTGILAQLGLTAPPDLTTRNPTTRNPTPPNLPMPNLRMPNLPLPNLPLPNLRMPNLPLPDLRTPDLSHGPLAIGLPGVLDESTLLEAADAGGHLDRRTHHAPAGSRDYLLYRPSDLPDGPRPLIVMLHGGTQTAPDFAAGTRMNHLAERHGFLVAYPEQSRAANPRGYWHWFRAEDQVAGSGEPSVLAGVVQEIAGEHEIDRGKIYVAGLSAGGAMAAVLAGTYPELFAGVGVHSGIGYRAASDLPSAFAAMQGAGAPVAGSPVRTIVVHGDGDHLVAPVNAELIVDATLADHPGLTRQRTCQPAGGGGHTIETYRDTSGLARIESWTVHGGGHCWFGGDPVGSYTDPKGPDASTAMVRFFLDVPDVDG